MTMAENTQPILLELGEAAWKEQVDRAETRFGNTLTVRSAFRRLAHDTHEKTNEPHTPGITSGRS